MADGVPGHEDPDLSQQVDRYTKRRAPPLRFNNFQWWSCRLRDGWGGKRAPRDGHNKSLLLTRAKKSGSLFKLFAI